MPSFSHSNCQCRVAQALALLGFQVVVHAHHTTGDLVARDVSVTLEELVPEEDVPDSCPAGHVESPDDLAIARRHLVEARDEHELPPSLAVSLRVREELASQPPVAQVCPLAQEVLDETDVRLGWCQVHLGV